MNRYMVYGIFAAAVLWTVPPVSAQALDGQYDYYVLDRANVEGSQVNAWYGDNNWYNTYDYLGYRYTPRNPYSYSSNYSYPGAGPGFGASYGAFGPNVFGNWDDDWDDRDSGFFNRGLEF